MPEASQAFRSGLSRRDEIMGKIPRWYRGEVHFALVNLLAGIVLWLDLRDLDHPSVLDLAVAPASFLFANWFEWTIHRGPLHHPTRLRILYERHTLSHHAAFSHESMAIRDGRELRFVLFPLPALLGAMLIDLPFGLLFGVLLSPDAGRIFFGVALGYYVLYEWCHLAFHMPETSLIGKNPITRWLRTTHTRHHDPRLMTKKNFNVTFPIFDAILGTLDR